MVNISKNIYNKTHYLADILQDLGYIIKYPNFYDTIKVKIFPDFIRKQRKNQLTQKNNLNQKSNFASKLLFSIKIIFPIK